MEMSTDFKTKSEQIITQNIKLSEQIFTKLKAFKDILNMPNYLNEEVRQKKILAEKIIRVMFEEEQRLRKGGNLFETHQLDKILLSFPKCMTCKSMIKIITKFVLLKKN